MYKIKRGKGGRRENILDFNTISPLIKPKEITLEEALKLFLQDCSIRNLSEKTIEWYQDKLNIFLREVGDGINSPADITTEHFKAFIVNYRNGPDGRRADASINGVLRAVRAFLNYCYAESLTSVNVGAKIKLVKEKQKVIETFTKEQIRQLLKQPDLKTFIGFRDFTMLLLLLETGIRVSELVGINVHDINFREGLILIDGKGNKQRTVPVQLTTLKKLQEYANIRGELGTTAFFVTLDNTPVSIRQVQQQIKNYGQQAGIKNVRCSPHTMRHTFAKFYIQNNGDPFTLQKLLGHTDLSMTRKYVNMFNTDIQEAHRKYSPVENLLR